jgi:hypothetical protein
MKRFLSFSLLILALSSCSKTPDGVLPEQQMKDMLIDMHLAESLINENFHTYADSASKAALFEAVFRKHGITQAVYDSSLVWYGKHLDVFLEVYGLADNEINNRIRAIGDVQAAASTANNANLDSMDIWPRRNLLDLYPKAAFNATTFNIHPPLPYPAGSSFRLHLRLWGVDKRMGHFPEVRLMAELGDTAVALTDTLRANGIHVLRLNTPEGFPIRSLHGYIRLDGEDSTYYKIYIDKLRLMKYKPGSK